MREDSGGRAGAPPKPAPPTGDDEGWSPIPPSLASHYRYLGAIAATGNEAAIYRVLSRKTSRQLLLKLYKKGVHLNPATLRRIQRTIDSSHVVHLHGFGPVEETGQWCEVQEYVEGGDLLSLIAPPAGASPGTPGRPVTGKLFVDVVAELSQAIAAFHHAGLAHHDIKPANILVRTREPLDLVLADFGLSIAADRTVFLSRRAGTIAYDSPESLGAGQGGPKRDYWALGMTLAELAAGRHPFAVSGSEGLLSDPAIRDHLYARRPIDLSRVEEPRARRLCEGLTRYGEDNRWGSAQVQAWLDGGDPPVAPNETRDQPSPARPAPQGFDFPGRTCGTRQELAEAMAGDWRASVALLGTEQRRREFLDRVSTTFGGGGIAKLEASWEAQRPGVDRAITDLMATLNPESPPIVVSGLAVDRANLAGLARSVASGDPAAARAVGALWSQGCLASFASIPGHQDLAAVDRDWRAAVTAFQGHVAAAMAAGAVLTITDADVQAQLLGMVADPEFARESLTAGAARPSAGAMRQPWYRPIAGAHRGDHAGALAAVLLAGEAERLNSEEIAQREQAQQEALRGSVASLRAWLRWPIVANAVVAGGLAACHYQREKLLEAVLRDGELDPWVTPLLQRVSWWWVWAVMAVGAFVGRRAVRGAGDPVIVRAAQLLSVVTTLAVPILIPSGLWQAFRSQRRRTGAGRSGLRTWAVGGSVGTALVLIGLWANRAFDLFRHVFEAWPGAVQDWYLGHWPNALDPGNLGARLGLLAIFGLATLSVGLAGAWLSYARPNHSGVVAAQTVGGVSGVIFGVAGLPVAVTGLAFVGYAALVVALVVAGAALVIAVLGDSC